MVSVLALSSACILACVHQPFELQVRLTRSHSGKGVRSTPVQFLLAATVALYASTCVFYAYSLKGAATYTGLLMSADLGMYSDTYTSDFERLSAAQLQTSCATTSALSINVRPHGVVSSGMSGF